MKRTALLLLLLGTLIVEAGLLFMKDGTATTAGMDWRIGFFILTPLALALLVGLQFRWAAMACVIYATVGLAMDLAMIVQTFTQDSEEAVSMIGNGISGLFNFCLIVFGGRLFLEVGRGSMPLESRPPSPPSPS